MIITTSASIDKSNRAKRMKTTLQPLPMTVNRKSDTTEFVCTSDGVRQPSTRRFYLHNEIGLEWPRVRLWQTINTSTTERPQADRHLLKDDHDRGMKCSLPRNSWNNAETYKCKLNHRAIARISRTLARARTDLVRNYKSVDCGLSTYLPIEQRSTTTRTRAGSWRRWSWLESIPFLSVWYATKHKVHNWLAEGAMRKRPSLRLLWLQLNKYCTTNAAC